jgi:hypothetical protein
VSSTYRVAVHREGRYWVAVVDGLRGGATEVRTIAALEVEVRDLISALADVEPDSFDLDWDYADALPKRARSAVAEVNTWRARRTEAEANYAKAQAEAAARLSAAGVSVRDTARLLGISPPRVVQLTKSPLGGAQGNRDSTARRRRPAARSATS